MNLQQIVKLGCVSLVMAIAIQPFVCFVSATSTSTSIDAQTLQHLRQKILDEHNKYRKKHNISSELTLDEELNDGAQKLADTYIFGHSPITTEYPQGYQKSRYYVYVPDSESRTGYKRYWVGENIEWSRGYPTDEAAVSVALKAWYDTSIGYDYTSGQPRNFTLMVWKSTTKIGCGISRYNGNERIVVCHYAPTGNIKELFKENVFPPIP